ncbi:AraC family transcriptional regulator [Streptomyces sp. NPDC004647]|uniref:AraC family transcriptional regulator n=1 Tax=Streptomyces sp. NPDC004647 TaxID=3154671 RepID=UPI0033B999E4
MTEEIPDSCRVMAWRPSVPGVSEVFHARIVDYRYPAHCHDTWTVLIVDDGAIRYDLDTRHHGAVGSSVSILPPGVVHNGYPSERYGRFRKRCLYLDSTFLPTRLVGASVDISTFHDHELRFAISRLHDRLVTPDQLDTDARLAMIAERFSRHLELRTAAIPEPEPNLAHRLRAFLDGHVTTKVTLVEAAGLFDRTIPHLVRSFKRQYGVSPHAYVTGARIELARKQLLQGRSPARVATEVGFHDQAHLTRHFKRHVSVPPAQYAAGRGIIRLLIG